MKFVMLCLFVVVVLIMVLVMLFVYWMWMLLFVIVLFGIDNWVMIDVVVLNDLFFFDYQLLCLDGVKVWQFDGIEGKLQNGFIGCYCLVFDIQFDKFGMWKVGIMLFGVMGSFKVDGVEQCIGCCGGFLGSLGGLGGQQCGEGGMVCGGLLLGGGEGLGLG